MNGYMSSGCPNCGAEVDVCGVDSFGYPEIGEDLFQVYCPRCSAHLDVTFEPCLSVADAGDEDDEDADINEVVKAEATQDSKEPQFIQLTEDQFEARYPLVPNHLNPNASWEGCLFETCGDEWEFVRQQDESKVWTLIEDGEGGECIVSGVHLVNRLGYLVSTVRVPEGTSFEVGLPTSDDDDPEAALDAVIAFLERDRALELLHQHIDREGLTGQFKRFLEDQE